MPNKTSVCLIDTGADLSLIRIGVLREKTFINGRINCELMGIAKGNARTIGISCGDVLIDNKLINHEFHVVSEGIIPKPYDAILGIKFFQENKICIDFSNNTVTVKNDKFLDTNEMKNSESKIYEKEEKVKKVKRVRFNNEDLDEYRRDSKFKINGKSKKLKDRNQVGFKNHGINCGINSVLQTILKVDKFCKQIRENSIDENAKGKEICMSLKSILKKIDNGSEVIDPKEFIDAFGKVYPNLCNSEQQDVHEIFKGVKEVLLNCMKISVTDGKLKKVINCETCNYMKIMEEDFNDLSIEVNENSLSKCVEGFFQKELIEGYSCPICSKKNIYINYKMEEAPDILSIQLKRFNNQGMKLNKRIKVEDVLNVKECYNLKALISHEGSSGSGHYVSIIKHEKGYILFDDETVTNIDEQDKIINESLIYMLFYEKDKLNVIEEKQLQATYSKNNPLIIPKRKKKLIYIEVENPGQYLCKNKTLDNGLIIGNGITEIKNNRGIISVINSSKQDIEIHELQLELEPIHTYDILNFKKNYNERETQNRIKKIKEIIGKDNLNELEIKKLEEIIENYNDVFHLEHDKLSLCKTVEHSIPIFTDSSVINVRPYRLPILQRVEINKQIDKMLEDELVVESKSAWNAPLLLVPKKAKPNEPKKWRIVIDFRKLNEITISDSFPLPNINEILDQLGQSKYFSTLDLSQGYHQIGMSKESRSLTAFSTPMGHYEWTRMPMGLKSSSHTFQRLMNAVLTGLNGNEAFVYLDDIVIYGYSLENHAKRLKRVLQRLREHNLKLQPEKCKFFCKEVIYLGHKITEKGIFPDPDKFEAIKNFPYPQKPKDIKSFLGMVGYYRKFVPNFAELAKPLTSLLKKEVKFAWSQECEVAFQTLKEKLISEPILQYPDFQKEFFLTTDASGKAIGAVLSQKDNDGNDLPIAYASRTLLDAETRYSTTERELLAIVWGVEHFNIYLYGRKFTIFSDHKPLRWLMNVKDPKSRLIRWKLRLSKYDFEIQHIKGKSNFVADCLSRNKESKEIFVLTRATAKKERENKMEKLDNSSVQKVESNEKVNEKVTPKIIESDDKNLLNEYKIRIKVSSQEEEYNDNPENKYEIGEMVFKENKNEFLLITKLKEDDPINLDDMKIGLIKILEKLQSVNKKHFCYIIKHEINNKVFELEEIKAMILEVFKNELIYFLIFENTKNLLTKQEEINRVLREFHKNPLGGHQGVKRMMSKIKNRFIFDKMKQIITEFVTNCEDCQKNKFSITHKMPMKITSTARKPFERIAIDVVGPLPETEEGYKYLLTFQDDLTKFVGAIPIKDQEAETIAKAFVHNIILKFGFRENLSVLSDMGTNFQSELFKRICKLLKIKKRNTSPWHPETNGALERSHRTLKEYLRNYVVDINEWDKFVEFGIFTMNSSKNEATGYSPFELVFGYKIHVPTSLTAKPEPIYNYDNYYYELKYKFQKAFDIARQNQIQTKENTKKYFDKKIKPVQFKEGDLVLMKNFTKKGEGRKLQPLYKGPYEVIKVISETDVKIKIGRSEKIIHNNNLKIYKQKDN